MARTATFEAGISPFGESQLAADVSSSPSLRGCQCYQANPNLIRDSDGTNTYTFSYDWDDRLTNFDAPGTGNDGAYSYDSMGWRRKRSGGRTMNELEGLIPRAGKWLAGLTRYSRRHARCVGATA